MRTDSRLRDGPGVGWAVIGASTIGREFMVPAIRATGGEPLWVVSHDRARAAAFAEQCAVPSPTDRLAEALADPRVGAVYVGSANSHHAGQVLAAVEAGKHVLCDKPLASTSADALRMVRAAEEAGLVLAVNHHLRASRLHQTMRAMIADGAIGTVRSVVIINAGYLRPVLQTWRITDAAEGAIYLDLSVHDVDLTRFLLAVEPGEAVGLGGAYALGAAGVHDQTTYAVRMDSGVLLQAHDSFVAAAGENLVTAFGSEGSLRASGSLGPQAAGTLVHRRGGEENVIPVAPAEPYVGTMRAFLGAVYGDGQPLASGRDGLISLATAEAIATAARTGRAQTVDRFAAPPETMAAMPTESRSAHQPELQP